MELKFVAMQWRKVPIHVELEDMEHWFEENGVRRRAEKSVCKNCDNDFLHRKNRTPKYCSTDCASKAKNTSVELECFSCGKKFARRKSQLNSAKHGVFFCSRKCKDKEQRLDGRCDKIRPEHYGTGWSKYRDRCEQELEDGCRCGERRKYLLLIHHMDSDRKNCKKENLEVVCGNCHIIRHLQWNGTEWVFNPRVLTPREKIEELTFGAIV